VILETSKIRSIWEAVLYLWTKRTLLLTDSLTND